jgi:hypothetical protein
MLLARAYLALEARCAAEVKLADALLWVLAKIGRMSGRGQGLNRLGKSQGYAGKLPRLVT